MHDLARTYSSSSTGADGGIVITPKPTRILNPFMGLNDDNDDDDDDDDDGSDSESTAAATTDVYRALE